MESVADLAVRKSVTVQAPVEDAFRVFTEGIAAWWPLRTHSVAEERAETVVLEGRVGGRLYERTTEGEEHVWGEIVAWEPPRRIVYDWHPARGPETAQEVEIRFTPEGDSTRVEVDHRAWERAGERAKQMIPSYEEGWDHVLGLYARAAAR